MPERAAESACGGFWVLPQADHQVNNNNNVDNPVQQHEYANNPFCGYSNETLATTSIGGLRDLLD